MNQEDNIECDGAVTTFARKEAGAIRARHVHAKHASQHRATRRSPSLILETQHLLGIGTTHGEMSS